MGRKKNKGEKRAKKVQARKKKEQAKTHESSGFETHRDDNWPGERDFTEIPDRRLMERAIAQAIGLNEDLSEAEEEANELFYRALEATTPKARLQGLDATLRKNPRHLDALVELANLNPDEDQGISMLQTAVQIGEQDLKRELEEDVGYFWGLHHTRPYMRARNALAERYFDKGELDQAAREMEDMLRLNPHDNQGIRWRLMEIYCRQDDLEKAERLFEQYPDEGTPFLAFTGLLIRFRKEGDSPELREDSQGAGGVESAHRAPALESRTDFPRTGRNVYPQISRRSGPLLPTVPLGLEIDSGRDYVAAASRAGFAPFRRGG